MKQTGTTYDIPNTGEKDIRDKMEQLRNALLRKGFQTDSCNNFSYTIYSKGSPIERENRIGKVVWDEVFVTGDPDLESFVDTFEFSK